MNDEIKKWFENCSKRWYEVVGYYSIVNILSSL